MINELKKKFKEEYIKVDITIKNTLFEFNILNQFKMIDRFNIISNIINTISDDNVRTEHLDEVFADILLKFSIIDHCTDIDLSHIKDFNDVIDFFDLCGASGVEAILEKISDILGENIYSNLKKILDLKIVEFNNNMKLENSFLNQFKNLISNFNIEDFEKIIETLPKLENIINKIDKKEKNANGEFK